MIKLRSTPFPFASLLVLTALATGCGAHHTEEHEGHEHGRYPATSPLVTDTVVARDYVCQIHSVQHIELRALEKGYLRCV